VAVAYGETQADADAAADRLAASYEAAAPAFLKNEAYDPDAAVAEALSRAAGAGRGPVVIADTQDNPGAGGVSATTGMLRALVKAEAQNAAIGLIVDPATAEAAHLAGVGADVNVALGGHASVTNDAPFQTTATVMHLSDGTLRATGPYYGGTALNLGPSACLRIGGVHVVVTSRIAQMADREMFRFVGIPPEEMGLLVVKSSTHFRADFAPIARDILVACAPGPMPLNPADLPFTRLRAGLRLSPDGPRFGADGAPSAPPDHGGKTAMAQ
jgi:microcystin degradation protein MlrC